LILLFSSVLAMAGAAAGVWLSSVPEVSRRVVPLGGIVLLLLSLLWVMPELAGTFGWELGPTLMLAGFGLVWAIDRFLYPVCPACAHTHDHDACSTRLHGFAMPLIAAALIHSLFDGWTLAAGQELSGGAALTAGVIIHKIPESIAYGVILKAALRSRSQALGWALGAQAATVAGALLAIVVAPVIGSRWMGMLLAIGGGTFLYLGFHAVHGEWKRRTAERAVRVS
jgi:zinc transporter ZupT